jgi:hypothetical protein
MLGEHFLAKKGFILNKKPVPLDNIFLFPSGGEIAKK